MNILLALLVFVPIIIGFCIYNIKNDKTLWKITLITIGIMFVLSLFLLVNFTETSLNLPLFSDFGINFTTRQLGVFYVFMSCVLWPVSVIASKEYFSHNARNLNRYYASLLITFGGCIGVFLSGDLFTLFVFFEVMSFASYIWVAQNQDEKSVVASNSYLAFAVFGGLSLLFGIFIFNADMPVLGCFFIFVGFGTKASAFFFHDWLPLSHTAAPAPASGLLSGLLTKAGVYGIILITIELIPESEAFAMFILIISMLNMLFGAICAFSSANLKRTLAFSSVSQIGFILWGVSLINLLGEHNSYAAYGTVFHMTNHSLIKVLLFCIAGIVYQNAHSLDLNDLKGFGKDKPWLKILFGVGAISVAGIPLFSGYISKTLLHESMVEYIHYYNSSAIFSIFEYLFLLAGGFTLAYMLKLYNCLFVQEPEKDYKIPNYATLKTKISLSIIACALFILGFLPNITFNAIGEFTSHFFGAHVIESISYFSLENLKGSSISISIGLIIYFGSRYLSKSSDTNKKEYIDKIPENYTLEVLFYKPLIKALSFIFALIFRFFDISLDLIIMLLNKYIFKTAKIPDEFFNGRERFHKRSEIHITYSLSYSLLMFGLGFIFTIVYLLVVSA